MLVVRFREQGHLASRISEFQLSPFCGYFGSVEQRQYLGGSGWSLDMGVGYLGYALFVVLSSK